jgi:glycosyltransferase involved in cell wall biosynthesis
MNVQPDLISTSGREMRDYGTLITAIRDLNVRCHIGATTMKGKKDRWIDDVERAKPLPPHITVGLNEKISDIRTWYARSHFVVLPLFPCLQAIGSTVILEAMAMERPVICSRVDGQRDIIIEGKTGLFVPPEDPRALRDAIKYLWDNPQVAAAMGKEARKRVEQYFTLDNWIDRIKATVEEIITTKSRKKVPING